LRFGAQGIGFKGKGVGMPARGYMFTTQAL